MQPEYCPRCGTERVGALRFCRSCAFDFDAAGEITRAPAPSTQALPESTPIEAGRAGQVGAADGDPRSAFEKTPTPTLAKSGADPATMRLLAALAWIGCGLLTGYLALVQIGYAGTIIDDGSLTSLAAWNAIVAVGVIYGGVKLLGATARSTFRTSAIWAAVIALVQGFQVAQGASHFAYIGSTVAAVGAGIFAWMVYQAIPPDQPSVPRETTAYRRAQGKPARERVLIVVFALIAVVAVLWVAGRIAG
jgi:hypothetical protein